VLLQDNVRALRKINGEVSMQVQDVMSTEVQVVSPEDRIEHVVKIMKSGNFGALLVGLDDRLRGVITDRDILMRSLAEEKSPENCFVKDCMSDGIHFCFEDENLMEAGLKMAAHKTRRLAVLNRQKRLVGIVTLCDLAKATDSDNFIHLALKAIATEDPLQSESPYCEWHQELSFHPM